MAGFGEAFPGNKIEQPTQSAIETLLTNPEKLDVQTLESLPTFLGYEETPEMAEMRTHILAEAENGSPTDFTTALNPYLIASDEYVSAITPDQTRLLAEIGQILNEAYFYGSAGEQSRCNEALEQAEAKAYGMGYPELALKIKSI